MSSLLAALNPQQKRAAETLEGPVLVLAGAGTGKTKVLTTRLALLLSKGIDGRELLAVTFTNKAAREMRERARKLGGDAAKDIWLSTFHALCARILRAEITALGWRKDFLIYDDSDQESVLRGVLKELQVPGAQASPDAVRWRISQAKNRGFGPAEIGAGEEEVDEVAARSYERYNAALKARNALDFDDLLTLTVRLFNERPAVLDKYRRQFRYLMVDEYQDTNAPQYDIVRTLAGARRNLFVVGDDDQAIYGWRGADHAHILAFERDFPGATVVRLEKNYRSTQAVLAAATAVISKNAARHPKTLTTSLGAGAPVRLVSLADERAEAIWIAGRIRESRAAGRPFREHAVLFRTNDQTRPLEEQLRLARIPYSVVGGQRFYDRREVRDALAYLRLLSDPSDDAALLRIANVPPRGIGDASIERFGAFAAQNGLPLLEAFRRAGEAGVPKAAAASAVRLAAKIDAARAAQEPVSAATELFDSVDMASELRRESASEEAGEARVAALDGVLSDLGAYVKGGGTVAAWLEKIALLDTDTADDERDAVTLLTIHAAKGLEFGFVCVAGMEDGVFPHRRSAATETGLEEERRLLYVAMTRAKQELVLTYPEKRVKRGRELESVPSRFLAELPASVVREAPGKRELSENEMEDLNAKVQELLAKGRPPG
jgi:DNA helicase-2/ATP-dependent DNA helicase PcrA